MSFAADAIGFYLQLDDQLTPQLEVAGKAYGRFVKVLEKQNTRAVKVASKGFGAITAMARAFKDVPKQAITSYKTAQKSLMKLARKPIRQTVEMVFGSQRSKDAMARAVASVIMKALRKVTIRMAPGVPRSRQRGFDSTQNMRTAYRHQLQPPDYAGKFANLPRFSKGGIVKQGKREGIDDVLALLSKNEMVLPAKVAKQLKFNAKRSFAGIQALSKTGSDVENLDKLLRKLVDKSVKGALTSGERSAMKKAVALAGPAIHNMRVDFEKLSKSAKKDLMPYMSTAEKSMKRQMTYAHDWLRTTSMTRKIMAAIRGSFESIDGTAKKIATNTGFLALIKSFKVIQEHGAHKDFGGEEINSLFDNAQTVNRKFHLSRAELAGLRLEASKTAAAMGAVLNPADIGEAQQNLVQAGISTVDDMKKVQTLTALMTNGFEISGDAAAEFNVQLQRTAKFTQDDLAAAFIDLDKVAQKTSAHVGDLAQQITQDTNAMGIAFQSITDPNAKRAVMANLGRLQGALQDQIGTEGAQGFTRMLSQAQGGDQQSIANMMNLTGMSSSEIMGRLQSGDTGDIVKNMAKMGSQGGNNAQVQTALQGLGFSDAGMGVDAMAKLQVNVGDVTKKLKELNVPLTKTTDGMQEAADAASHQNTAFKGVFNTITDFFATHGGQRVLDFFSEFNPMALAAYGFLGLKLYPAFKKFGGLLKGLLGGVLKRATGGIFGMLFGGKVAGSMGGFSRTAGLFQKIGQGFLMLGRMAIPLIVAGLTALGPIIAGIGAAIAGWAVAAGGFLLAMAPILLLVGSLVFLSAMVYKYWTDIKDIFNGDLFKDLWHGTVDAFKNKGAVTPAEIAALKSKVAATAPSSGAVKDSSVAASAQGASMSTATADPQMETQNDILAKILAALQGGGLPTATLSPAGGPPPGRGQNLFTDQLARGMH